MLFTSIKNNLKLILRNKVLIISMMLAPVGVMWVLSGVFEDMLHIYSETDTMQIAYSVDDDSPYKGFLDQMKNENSMEGIEINRYQVDETQIESVIKNNDIAAFLLIGSDSYTIYEYNKYKNQLGIIENVITTMFEEIQNISKMDIEKKKVSYSEIVTIDVIPMPSSFDYYGIIELTYFAMCGVVTISMVVGSERKNRIIRRMQVARVSNFKVYLAKLIPCTLGISIELIGAMVLSHIIVGNRFGNYPETIGILFLLAVASSAYGILALHIVKNLAVSVIIVFSSVWFMGFYGGSFQNYMMNTAPDIFVKLSPMYYVNRTLVEFRTMGHSSYALPAVCILIGMIVICSLASVLLIKREMEE